MTKQAMLEDCAIAHHVNGDRSGAKAIRFAIAAGRRLAEAKYPDHAESIENAFAYALSTAQIGQCRMIGKRHCV